MSAPNRFALVASVLMALSSGSALADKPDRAGGGKGPGGEHGHQGQPHGHEHDTPGDDHGKGGQGKGGHDKPDRAETNAAVTGRLPQGDIVVVQRYFQSYPGQYEALPPGIAKKLARGKPLPPGIAKKMAPYELRQQIPLCMNGWECILAGADMLILDAVHGTIRDIVRGAVR